MKTSFGCFITVLVFNLIVGGWSVNYLAETFTGKLLPALAAVLVGTFVAELTVPAAIVVWALQLLGFIVPIVH